MMIGVLLAAGQSSRFGGDKLLQRLNDKANSSLVEQSYLALQPNVDEVCIIVRPNHIALINALMPYRSCIKICTTAHLGMAASIICAIQAFPNARAWLIALADMPWIQPSTCQALIHQLTIGATITQPRYAGQPGHPVGFAHCHKGALLKLQGDCGARNILQQNAQQITYIDVTDPGILIDVDTPEDLHRQRVS